MICQIHLFKLVLVLSMSLSDAEKSKRQEHFKEKLAFLPLAEVNRNYHSNSLSHPSNNHNLIISHLLPSSTMNQYYSDTVGSNINKKTIEDPSKETLLDAKNEAIRNILDGSNYNLFSPYSSSEDTPSQKSIENSDHLWIPLSIVNDDNEGAYIPPNPMLYDDYRFSSHYRDFLGLLPPPLFRTSSESSSFNMEGSDIVEAAFIVPEDKVGVLPLPPPEAPKKSYALTVSDGQVNRNEVRKDDGEYISSYTSADGTIRKEIGQLVSKPNGERVLVIRGSYVYTSPEGQKIKVDYQADKNGFRIVNRKPLSNRRPLAGRKPSAPGNSGHKVPHNENPHSAQPMNNKQLTTKPLFSSEPGSGKPQSINRKPPNNILLSGNPSIDTLFSEKPLDTGPISKIPQSNRPFNNVPLGNTPFNIKKASRRPVIHRLFTENT